MTPEVAGTVLFYHCLQGGGQGGTMGVRTVKRVRHQSSQTYVNIINHFYKNPNGFVCVFRGSGTGIEWQHQ